MALINCPECRTQISEHALKCVKCGFPLINISTSKPQPTFKSQDIKQTGTIETNATESKTNLSAIAKEKAKNSFATISFVVGVVVVICCGRVLWIIFFNKPEHSSYSSHSYSEIFFGNEDNNLGNEDNNQSQIEEKVVDVGNYLTSNTFTLNGNGSVSFNKIGMGSKNNGQVTIKGGRADLIGNYSVSTSGTIQITDLKAYDGYFDANNNNSTSGTFYLQSNGSITGSLYGKNDSRDVTFSPR